MLSHEQALTNEVAALFGENAKVSHVQRLFARGYLHAKNFFGKKTRGSYATQLIHYEIAKVMAKELEDEINKEMPKHDAPNFNKYLAMKAHVYTLQSDVKYPKNVSLLKKVIDLLEPIKLEPEAVYFYINALIMSGLAFKRYSELQTCIKYFINAENTYKKFLERNTNVNDAMTPLEVFGATVTEQFSYNLEALNHVTTINLFECYKILENMEMKLKYVLPSIKAVVALQVIQQKTYNIRFDRVIFELIFQVGFLIGTFQFAQVNHLLSIFMYHLVKHKRTLPKEEHEEIIKAQVVVSQWYTNWAMFINYYTSCSLRDPNFVKNVPINNDYYRFERFIEAGVEIYENQFPCEPVKSFKEMKKVIKKGKAWCKTGFDLMGNRPIPPEFMEIMNKITALEANIEMYKTAFH